MRSEGFVWFPGRLLANRRKFMGKTTGFKDTADGFQPKRIFTKLLAKE